MDPEGVTDFLFCGLQPDTSITLDATGNYGAGIKKHPNPYPYILCNMSNYRMGKKSKLLILSEYVNKTTGLVKKDFADFIGIIEFKLRKVGRM